MYYELLTTPEVRYPTTMDQISYLHARGQTPLLEQARISDHSNAFGKKSDPEGRISDTPIEDISTVEQVGFLTLFHGGLVGYPALTRPGGRIFRHLTHSDSSLVPHGAHSALPDLLVVSVMQNHYISTLLCISNCCKMSLSSIIKASNLLLWQGCAPHGSFVLTGAPRGFCDAKLQNIDPIYVCPTAVKCLDPLLSKRQTYCYRRPVPHRAHSSLMDIIVVSVVQNSICRPFYVCQTAAKCLHQ